MVRGRALRGFRGPLRRFCGRVEGSSLVEFAVTLPVLLMLIFGIMECSLALYVNHFVTNAAHEATRYAMVRGSSWKGVACSSPATGGCTATAASVTAYVQSIAPSGIDPAKLTVTATWPGVSAGGLGCTVATGPNSPGCLVTAGVSYNFPFSVPFVPASVWVLSSRSTLTIVQ